MTTSAAHQLETLNPFSEALDRALAESQKRKSRIYIAWPIDATVPELIFRAGIADQGRFCELWNQNCSLRIDNATGFSHFKMRFLAGRDYYKVSTQEMLVANNLHSTAGHATTAELLRFFIQHRKMAMDYLKQGKIFAAMGHDCFKAAYWTYTELFLDDRGRLVIERKNHLPGEWTTDHILLIRASPSS